MADIKDVHCSNDKCGRVVAQTDGKAYYMGGVIVEAVAGRCPVCGECFSLPETSDIIFTAEHLEEIRILTSDIKGKYKGFGVIALEFQKGRIRFITFTKKREFCL